MDTYHCGTYKYYDYIFYCITFDHIYIDVTVIQHATNNVADPRLLLFHSPLPQQTSTV